MPSTCGCPCLRPPGPGGSGGAGADDGALVLDVLVDGGPPEFPADARGSVAAEGDLGESVHPAVDPDGSRLGRPGVAEGGVDVAGPHPRAEAVSGRVGDLDRLG